LKTPIIAAALIVGSMGIALAQNAEKGATLFKQCSACNKIGPGATNPVGPEFDGLDCRRHT
jgi:cytochrome c